MAIFTEPDRPLHYIVAAAITLLFFALFKERAKVNIYTCLLLATLAANFLGITLELYQHIGGKPFSTKDLYFNLLGSLTAVVLITAVYTEKIAGPEA